MTSWTPERRSQLHTLHGQGLSYNEIARTMELSRNAVARKCSSLGLRRKPQPTTSPARTDLSVELQRTFNPYRTRAAALVAHTDDAWPEPLPTSLNLPLLDLRDSTCHFPTLRPSEHLFCGAPAYTPPDRKHPLPYCQQHCKIAYRPMQNPYAF